MLSGTRDLPSGAMQPQLRVEQQLAGRAMERLGAGKRDTDVIIQRQRSLLFDSR